MDENINPGMYGIFLILTLFNVRGDVVWSSSFFGFSTHWYSLGFSGFLIQNQGSQYHPVPPCAG
jgi:hypothetical protein